MRKQKQVGESRRTASGSPTLPRTRRRDGCGRRGDEELPLPLKTHRRQTVCFYSSFSDIIYHNMQLSITSQTIDWLYKRFETSEQGLLPTEAELRRKKYGLNELSAKEIKWWHILGRQFRSPFIYLLIFAASLALVMRELIDGLMILVFVMINATLGFAEEYHSERSLRLLKKFVVTKARVRRHGHEMLVDSCLLVPGDVVLIETGDVVPADLRFIITNGLSIDESVITGESAPQNKSVATLKHEAKQLSDATNFGFMSTVVSAGKGVGVVVNTGKDTAVGGMAKLTSETERKSSFEKGIARFSSFILRMVVLIIVLLFAANIIIKGPEADLGNLLLFSIALAVSVIPEALPLVTTLSLSRGALRMAKGSVVVKRLSAVEDLGSIEVLCTDKTGTITENKLVVKEVYSKDERACLLSAGAASSFIGEGKQEPNNAFDLAIWNNLIATEKKSVLKCGRINEMPFDPARRRNSVVVKNNGGCRLIVRGAAESVLPLCEHLGNGELKRILKWVADKGVEGCRTIVVAEKKCEEMISYDDGAEKKLIFIGAIAFDDPIKSSTISAIEKARRLGVQVKILTGDSREVAGAVALKVGLIDDASKIITGEEIDVLPEKKRAAVIFENSVFARVSPEQKYRIIEVLQSKHEVGFLGEGINDAPALKLANVALAVNSASDIAREASDIVLLHSSLAVIIDGIKNGREVFANTVKYLKVTLVSNFGNFYAIAAASLIVPFLPMLPVQILLLNLLSDFPMVAIATDKVDKEELRRPRSYNIREVVLMAIILGLVSTIFDFIFFAIFFHREPAVLQAGWFIGSVLTELILIYSIRTRLAFWKAKMPSWPLLILTVSAVIFSVFLPLSHFGRSIFKFGILSLRDIFTILIVVFIYFIITELLKRIYYAKIGNGKLAA